MAVKSTVSRAERVKELQDKFKSQVVSLSGSEDWLKTMRFLARFKSYSFVNIMLILSQLPTAEVVAGYKQWRTMGRQVVKGSKAIHIFGYSSVYEKDENGERKVDAYGNFIRRTVFPILSVFDVSQTVPIEGEKDLYKVNTTIVPEGADPEGIADRLATALVADGWSVLEGDESVLGGADGMTVFSEKKVYIKQGMTEAGVAATMAHEMAHVMMHNPKALDSDPRYADKKIRRRVIETEAESVAYLVGEMNGISLGDTSKVYVANWSGGDEEIISNSAKAIFETAKAIDYLLNPAVGDIE